MRWIWRALTRRLVLKSIALLCACILWVYADTSAMQTRTVRARVRITHENGRPVKALEGVLGVFPAEVDVTVRGPKGRMAEVTTEGLFCHGFVPDDYLVGKTAARVPRESVVLPDIPALVVLDVEPAILHFSVDAEGNLKGYSEPASTRM